MKTILEYLDDYGKYTFLEKGFNEVDNVILSLLSYIDFYNIVPSIRCGSITLEDASKLFYEKNDSKMINKNISSVRFASNLLKKIAVTNRFKDLKLLNYDYQVTFDMQFGALCIKLPNKMMYVSFEGTDNYISGWEEDFMLTYTFPTKSQLAAINYLNKVACFYRHKIYVGGHSKGGNLALVSSMYCRRNIFYKIKHIYSNDGPGLRTKQLKSYRYRKASSKYTHIIPKEDFVGMILRNDGKHRVVDSYKKNFMQHNALNWIVEGDHFKESEISEFTRKSAKALSGLLDRYDEEKRKEFVNCLFSIFKKAEIDDLILLRQSKISNMLKILKEMKNINKEDRIILTNFLKQLYDEWKG